MTIAAPLPSSVEIAEDSETIDDHFFLPCLSIKLEPYGQEDVNGKI